MDTERAGLKGLNEHGLGFVGGQGEGGRDGGADGRKVAEEAAQVGGLHDEVGLRGHARRELRQRLLQAQAPQRAHLQCSQGFRV